MNSRKPYIAKLTLACFLFSTFACLAQPENLFNDDNFDIRCERGIVAVPRTWNGIQTLRISVLPSAGTPAVYFGTVKVSPGRKYSYFVRSTRPATSKINLYVTSETTNILWPGASLESVTAGSTFQVPDSISEITLAVAFSYPEKEDTIYVENIVLVEGDISSLPDGIRDLEFESSNLYTNILTSAMVSIRCEDGIAASACTLDDKNYLRVRCSPSQRDPAIYLATVKVTPGMDYTYVLKARKNISAPVLLYVTSQKGNLVWPGNELSEGIARHSFGVPPDITQITLAVAFQRPAEAGTLLIEDFGLFLGYATEWDPASQSFDFVELYVKEKKFAKWALAFSFVILVAIYLCDYKLRKRMVKSDR